MRRIQLIRYIAAAFFMFLACAVNERPSGGPEDKTPPTVMRVEPESGGTLLPLETSFKIIFSESMDRQGTEEAVFISPVFWDFPHFKWSGKELIVKVPERLKPNTTYILTVGAGASDVNRNKVGKSLTYAFSTGATIDSGDISGAVFSDEGQMVTYDIWAYGISDTSGTDFWLGIPDYATQVDSSGGFSLGFLGGGRYLIVAIDDGNNDLFWDPSSEALGLPPGIINLTHNQKIPGLVFRPARRDTAASYITKVVAIDRRKISLEFSQRPKAEQMLGAGSYRVTWSDGDSALGTGGSYAGEEGKLVLETDEQRAGIVYQLRAVGLYNIWGVPFDSAGITFTGSDVSDTVGPRLLSTFPANNSATVYQDSVVEMTFSERIQVIQFDNAVNAVADSADTLRFFPAWTTPNQVRLRFAAGIPRERSITIAIDPKRVLDIAGNPMPESSLAVSFRLPPADTVGSVVAEISPARPDIVGVLASLDLGGEQYQGKFSKAGFFDAAAVIPGNYRFEFFEDTDGDGEWSPGVISPFRPAERFSFLADTIMVRSRWTTEVGTVTLPHVAP